MSDSFVKLVFLELMRIFNLDSVKLYKIIDFFVFSVIVVIVASLVNKLLPLDFKRVYYLLITYFSIGLVKFFYEKYKNKVVMKFGWKK